MFRRAKLMLDRIDRSLVDEAQRSGSAVVATVRLTDHKGAPACARLDPPAINWTVGATGP